VSCGVSVHVVTAPPQPPSVQLLTSDGTASSPLFDGQCVNVLPSDSLRWTFDQSCSLQCVVRDADSHVVSVEPDASACRAVLDVSSLLRTAPHTVAFDVTATTLSGLLQSRPCRLRIVVAGGPLCAVHYAMDAARVLVCLCLCIMTAGLPSQLRVCMRRPMHVTVADDSLFVCVWRQRR
jgi:hypothetical protein